jgi:uncharacterized membrane protein
MSTLPPPQAPQPAPQAPAQPALNPGNGLAVAALTLGIVGLCVGLIPLFFWIAIPCGLLALIFGLSSRRRPVRRGMAWTGVVCGLLALILGVVGAVIVNKAVEDFSDCVDAVSADLNDGGNRSDEACD